MIRRGKTNNFLSDAALRRAWLDVNGTGKIVFLEKTAKDFRLSLPYVFYYFTVFLCASSFFRPFFLQFYPRHSLLRGTMKTL